MISQWPSVALTGMTHSIPRVCPNCLRPGQVEFRHDYRPLGLLGLTRLGRILGLGGKTYSQTFVYCPVCAKTLKGYLKYEESKVVLSFLWAIPITIVLTVLLNLGQSYGGPIPAWAEGWVMGATLLVFVGAAFWLMRRRRARLTGPIQQGQLLLGPAAYYRGPAFLSWGKSHVYRAARAEWLKLFVEANPASVDDATYQRIVGTRRPNVP